MPSYQDEIFFLRKENERRPTDWRWRRAVYLEDLQIPPAPHEDMYVTAIRRYLNLKHKGMDSSKLADKFPLFYEVDRIADESSDTRWLIEAQVMANHPSKEIAGAFGYTNDNLIQLYELCKFDIRSRLKFDNFIISEVLDSVRASTTGAPEEKLWKFFAWTGFRKGLGIELLNSYINLDAMPDSVQSWFDKFIKSQYRRKVTNAVIKGNPLHNQLVNDTVRTHVDIQKQELEAEKLSGMSGENTELVDGQRILLKSMEVTVASIERKPVNMTAETALDVEIRKQLESNALHGKLEVIEQKPREED